MTVPPISSFKGLFIALLIIFSWIGHLIYWLTIPIHNFQLWLILPMLFQMWLYTGLFITAHDAMHGIVTPGKKSINRLIGSVSVLFYAFFSYKKLLKKHHEHHKYPGTAKDPDFHPAQSRAFWPWYVRFMRNYISLPQILGMALIYNIFLHIAGINNLNLILFWIIPSLGSTFQLFYFGTFLPHREGETPFPDEHHARSLYYPVLVSFVTCFHFGGFHHEHHLYPNIPWWRLPSCGN